MKQTQTGWKFPDGWGLPHLGRVALILIILVQLFMPTSEPVNQVLAAPGDLTKTGTDTTTGSTTVTTRGHTIDWVVNYDSTVATPQLATLTDQIRNGQQFVTGSLQTPPGWSKTYSNNAGGSFGYTPSGSPTDPAVTHLRSSGFIPAKGAYADIAPSSLQAINSNTGGDGWNPIVYPTRNRIYNLYHHLNSGPVLGCLDMTTNAVCTTGGPFPKVIAGGTTYDAYEVVVGNILYYDTVDTSNLQVNLNAYNLDTDTFLWSLYWFGSNSGGVPWPGGLEKVVVGGDTRLYVGATEYQVGCYSVTFNAICAGSPYIVNSSSGIFKSHINGADGIVVNGTKIFYAVQSNDGSNDMYMYCFDAALNIRCTNGWASGIRIIPPNNTVPKAQPHWLFPWNNAAGVTIAVCAIYVANRAPTCYDANTAAGGIGSPPGLLNGLSLPDYTFYYRGYVVAATNRLYLPGYEWDKNGGQPTDNPSTSQAICYDFNTQSQCAGFGSPKAWPFLAGDYNYVESGGCMYGLGHKGVLWSFDPDTGQTPCYAQQKVSLQVQPSQFYCDGQSAAAHNVAWDKVKVWNVPGSLVSLTATLTNTATNAVLVNKGNLLPSGVLSISGINYAANPDLTVVVTAKGPMASAVKAGLLFTGDKPQFCYKTLVPASYVPNLVTNTVTNGTPADDATAVLQIPGVTMTKSVDKTVAGPGEVLTYSLLVNNIGGSPLSNIAVTDPVPVAGATLVGGSIQITPAAAGTAGSSLPNLATLNLATGASATVTFQLLLPTTGLSNGQVITNTATATPQPTDASPVSATATTTINLPDLTGSAKAVSGQAGPGNNTKPGDNLTYSVHVKNSANVPANGVNVSDVMDAALVVPPTAISNGGTYNAGTRTLSWTGLNIPAASGGVSGEVVLTYLVQVLPTATGGTLINNQAVITPPIGSVVNVNAPQLTVITPDLSPSTKGVSGQAGPGYTARPGDNLTYTVTILNNGLVAGTGVNVTDVVDVALAAPPTAISNGGTYNAGTRTITWTGLSIPAASGGTPGQLALTYKVQVLTTDPNGTLINNTAVISPPVEGGPGATVTAPQITVTTPDLSGSSKGVTVVPGP